MDDEIVECSMGIILNAGNARDDCFQALHHLSKSDFDKAAIYIKTAQELILTAHQLHTCYLQKTIQDERNEYSVLFAHAQDTLMTINSEINLTKHLADIFKSYDERIKHLELMMNRE